jgi:hypothetical protein
MHGGDIWSEATAAGRLFGILESRCGEWIGGWELTQLAMVSAVSTRVSEIRHALSAQPERGYAVESKQEGRRWYYRVVRTLGPEQLEFGDVA